MPLLKNWKDRCAGAPGAEQQRESSAVQLRFLSFIAGDPYPS